LNAIPLLVLAKWLVGGARRRQFSRGQAMLSVLEWLYKSVASFMLTPLAIAFAVVVTMVYFSLLSNGVFAEWFERNLRGQRLLISYARMLELGLNNVNDFLFGASNKSKSHYQRYLNFLSLAFGYSALWYILCWVEGADARIGSSSIMPDGVLAAERVAIFAVLLLLGVLLFFSAALHPKIDNYISIVLGDSHSVPLADRKIYKSILGACAGLCCAIALILKKEPWLLTWLADPSGVPGVLRKASSLGFSDAATMNILLSLAVGVLLYFLVTKIGDAFVAFLYFIGACVALVGDIPIHILLPVTLAIGAFYDAKAPIVVAILVVPICFVALELVPGSLLSSLGVNRTILLALLYSVPVGLYVGILESMGPTRNQFLLFLGKVFLGLIAAFALTLALTFRGSDFGGDAGKIVFVFWLLLPVQNSIFDMWAWRSNLASGRRLVREVRSAAEVNVGTESKFDVMLVVGLALKYCGRSILQAVVVVLVFTMVAVAALSLVNAGFVWIGSGAILDIEALIARMVINPYDPSVFWLTIALLTPLVPAVAMVLVSMMFVLVAPFSFGWAEHISVATALGSFKGGSKLSQLSDWAFTAFLLFVVMLGIELALLSMIVNLFSTSKSVVVELLRWNFKWAQLVRLAM
jgi:hypothetical protein